MTLNGYIDRDFDQLVDELKSRGIAKALLTSNREKLRRMHSIAYSFALWEELLSKKYDVESRKLFIIDLKSDLIQFIPLLLLGFKKASAILLRSTIENILRHLYFFDHRVEYERYRTHGFYLRQDEFYSYLKTHPELKTLAAQANLANVLSSKYSELSEIIHGKGVVAREFADNLKSVKFSQRFFDRSQSDLYTLSNIYVAILMVFHKDILQHFDHSGRVFLLSLLEKRTHNIVMKTIANS